MQRQHTVTTDIVYSTTHSAEWNYERFDELLSTSLDIPVSIYACNIPSLQATVRYMREHLLLSFTEISQLLGRAESTIRVTYRNAPKTALLDDNFLRMPINYFEKGLSPLETVVFFLREKGLRNVEVASTLKRDPRTTSLVFKRAKEKGVVLNA